MKKNLLSVLLILLATCFSAMAYDWDAVAIPASAGSGKVWELQSDVSDDFNYTFNATSYTTKFGSNKWTNFYHNTWTGPGYTYWNNSQVNVDGDDLIIEAGYTSNNSKGGTYGVLSGCVTSEGTVTYPVFVEAALSVANISLASCFWLLSPDDTEEIDIIENYGGVSTWKNYTHISHHSFVRSPFTDYQPKDRESWYPISTITAAGGWGAYCWNDGDRRYLRMGVNWIGPKHWEYYIDGELVRVMYYNAIATKYNGLWKYTYYNGLTTDDNGYKLPTTSSGYSAVTTYSTSSSYSLTTLQAASNASNGYSVIDPGWFQGEDLSDLDGNGITNEAKGFTKDLQIIINVESQSWLLDYTPSSADLNDASKNQMKVDWVRVYKPVTSGSPISVSEVSISETITVEEGATAMPTTIVLPNNASNMTVSYVSNNSGIASVNTTTGLITGESQGETTITVTTADGGHTDVCTVTVVESVAPEVGITIDDKTKYTTTDYVVGKTLDVTLSYNAGAGKTVGTSQYGVSGVQVLLREMTSDWSTVVKDVAVTDVSTVGKQYGTITLSIPLTGLTPSADLSTGNFYFIYPHFTNSDGAVYDVSGLNPITIVAAPASVDGNEEASFDIYPSPAKDVCYVKGAQGKGLKMFSLLGENVLSQELQNDLELLDLSALASGIYIVDVDQYQKKLIKE